LRDRVAGSRPGPIGGHNNNRGVQFMQQIAGTTKDQGPALPVTKDKSSARKGGGRVVDRCCGMCHVCGMLGPQTAQCHGLPFHCRATESLDTGPRARQKPPPGSHEPHEPHEPHEWKGPRVFPLGPRTWSKAAVGGPKAAVAS
jgi:hypothetical protein